MRMRLGVDEPEPCVHGFDSSIQGFRWALSKRGPREKLGVSWAESPSEQWAGLFRPVDSTEKLGV